MYYRCIDCVAREQYPWLAGRFFGYQVRASVAERLLWAMLRPSRNAFIAEARVLRFVLNLEAPSSASVFTDRPYRMAAARLFLFASFPPIWCRSGTVHVAVYAAIRPNLLFRGRRPRVEDDPTGLSSSVDTWPSQPDLSPVCKRTAVVVPVACVGRELRSVHVVLNALDRPSRSVSKGA